MRRQHTWARLLRHLGITVVLGVAVIPVLGGPAASAAGAAPPAPVWGPCAGVPEPTLGLRCATVEVPLDYRNPGGSTVHVGISGLPSTDPVKRRGVLFVDPGGQYTSELSLPLQLVSVGLPGSVRDEYDIIGFDPRGIGTSTPVTCDLSTAQMFTIPPSPYSHDVADEAASAARLRTVARQCGQSSSAARLPYMTTANVARDMDRIRRALGAPRISYLGYSFGTYIGSVYATLFPDRTDRVVLDSVVGPTGMDYTWSRRLALGTEQRFPDFAAWAAAQESTYHVGGSAAEVRATLFRLIGQLDRVPVEGIDGDLLRYITFNFLFADATFPYLGQVWQLLSAASAGEALDPDAVTFLHQVSNTAFDFSGLLHLDCNDSSSWPTNLRTYERDVAIDRVRYPIFGGAAAGVWPCAFWPVTHREPQVRIGAAGPSNILMVNNLRDPGTPLEGALQTRRALGARARLVTVDHGGHLVYLHDGNTCVDSMITRFLVDGARPATDTFCPR